ncbi:MAG TPA: zinc ribbon domain-containing protein [Thermoplasmata archaeon]|nr:zinc ribbon domain-containing protein [Thermoplasmata archaeon]
MIVRTAVLAAYAAVLGAALLIQFLYPALGVYVFYGLLFWLVASFFVFRMPGMGRTLPSGGPARPTPRISAEVPGAPPLPSTPPVALEFCAFCGTSLPEGAAKCPACGHTVRTF